MCLLIRMSNEGDILSVYDKWRRWILSHQLLCLNCSSWLPDKRPGLLAVHICSYWRELFSAKPADWLLFSSALYSNRWSVSAQPADCWPSFQNVSFDIGNTSFRRSLWISLCFPRTPLLVLQRYISSPKGVDGYCPGGAQFFRCTDFSSRLKNVGWLFFFWTSLLRSEMIVFSEAFRQLIFLPELSVDFIGNIFHRHLSGLYRFSNISLLVLEMIFTTIHCFSACRFCVNKYRTQNTCQLSLCICRYSFALKVNAIIYLKGVNVSTVIVLFWFAENQYC